LLGQRNEVAFRIDDRLLNPRGALLEKSTQQVRFPGARIALHQKARRQEFLEVQRRNVTRRGASNLDSNGHLPTQNSALGRRIYQSGPTRSSIPAEEVVESEWLTTIIALARSETGRYRSFRRTCRDRQHLAHAAADPPSR